MLKKTEAIKIVKEHIPFGTIKQIIEYENLFIFIVFSKSSLEEEYDPFYSVNRKTGEFKDFSILTDGDYDITFGLFLNE